MPRKPRLEIPGYYHIINRGVEKRKVFLEKADYEQFEELMCHYAGEHGITIHNYCLMSNHYHLLLEISEENLSHFMRQLNMNYAIYFNKKYERVGHLWQGRFKSWYVPNEAYLYTLMRYIEQNPLTAGMVKELGNYPYSSYRHFFEASPMSHCLKESWVVKRYRGDAEAIRAFFEYPVDPSDLREMREASSLIEASNQEKKPDIKRLEEELTKAEGTKERNQCILEAYESGYSQHLIAKVLGLNQSTVQRIVKRTKARK